MRAVSTQRLWARAPLMVMGATVLVLGAVALLLTLRLRADLRSQILRREAEALRSTVELQEGRADEEFARYGLGAELDDWFPLLLETSRLRGVVALRLFDSTGRLYDALPMPADARIEAGDWARLVAGESLARLHTNVVLAELEMGGAEGPGKGAEGGMAPLLEVQVPLRKPLGGGFGGVAQYWIDGAAMAGEFTALDRALWLRGGLAAGVGAAIVLAVLAWAFRRLRRAHRELQERTEDLARANQEFGLAAKTSALGAITAHLIHGIKNPLAGLEGYVAGQPEGAAADRGAEWRTAMETTRRLRVLVNEVVTILREEEAGGAMFDLSVAELLAQAEAKVRPLAAARGVKLVCRSSGAGELSNRQANLVLLVIDNLLRNACEATPAGGRVTAEVVGEEARAVFTVEDDGGGIPAEIAERLFQPVASTKAGGSGIGLVISRQLAQHAGGEIELVKSDAHGSCFRLTVPAKAG